jgi:hypothetical protein
VGALEAAAAGAAPGSGARREPSAAEPNYVDPSREELLERARRCGLVWDSPPLDLGAHRELDARAAQRLGLSEDERQIAGETLKGFAQKNMAEVGGDKGAAEMLSSSALQQEIVAKSPEGEAQEVFKRLSAERAGLIAPGPAGGGSPLERMMRLLTGLGDRFEQELAAQLGAARARELRAKKNGWGSRSASSYGCPPGP